MRHKLVPIGLFIALSAINVAGCKMFNTPTAQICRAHDMRPQYIAGGVSVCVDHDGRVFMFDE